MSYSSFKQNSPQYWSRKAISVLRACGAVSKGELCRQLGISMTSLNTVLGELASLNYIKSAGIGLSSGGRKPGLIALNGDGAYFIGMEFSIEGLSCAILDLTLKVCYQNYHSFHGTETSQDLTDAIIQELTLALSCEHIPNERILGACIGVPGYVDYPTGTLLLYSSHPLWNNFNILDALQPHFPWPLFIKNNVDVMPYAHKWVVCNGVCEDHVIMTIRYGFKISTCVNNQPIHGNHHFIGEIGHMRVPGSNRRCSCGKRGCFDTEVTYDAICQKIREGIRVGQFQNLNARIQANNDQLTIDLFIQACNEGDEEALRLMQETAETLCSAICWVYYMIDPAVIFINSRLVGYRGFFTLLAQSLYEHHENSFTYGKLILKPALFGRYLGAIGAAAYIYDCNFGTSH